jgi:cytochrome c oxidase cbb3-type subunit I/II
MLSIKSVSALAHYTDWIIGHVHSGALGWNGLMAAGMFYWMIPRLYRTELWSKRMADAHFWIATFAILLYVGAMWASGITQGLMWRATDAQGALLYPSFVETLDAIRPLYWMRLVGGIAYLAGMVMMAVNLVETARAGEAFDGSVEVPVEIPVAAEAPWTSLVFGRPVLVSVAVLGLAAAFAVSNLFAGVTFASAAFVVGLFGFLAVRATGGGEKAWHRLLEGRALLFTSLTLIAVLAGGVAELVPSLVIKPIESADARPYRALELEGRDIYVREGCYNCHSQMIRPFESERLRYGDPSTMADSQFDHPFQWGSKRTGPDLAREGGKYPSLWHYQHLEDPRAITPGSNMPLYAMLADGTIDLSHSHVKLEAMRTLGVPYTDADIRDAEADARDQGHAIASDLATAGVTVGETSEMVALISYLQRLGVKGAEPNRPVAPVISMRP